MVNVSFTEIEVNNLLAFLQTVQLTGKEVPAYVGVLNKITDGMEKKDGMEVSTTDD